MNKIFRTLEMLQKYLITDRNNLTPASKPVDWQSLEARYFVIKSNNMDNVEISMEKVTLLFQILVAFYVYLYLCIIFWI